MRKYVYANCDSSESLAQLNGRNIVKVEYNPNFLNVNTVSSLFPGVEVAEQRELGIDMICCIVEEGG